MRTGERPIGAARGKQTNTVASCQTPRLSRSPKFRRSLLRNATDLQNEGGGGRKQHLRPQSHSLTSRGLRGMRVIQGPVAGSLRGQRRIKGEAAGTPSPPPSRPNGRAREAPGPGGVAQCPHPPHEHSEHGGVIRRGGTN